MSETNSDAIHVFNETIETVIDAQAARQAGKWATMYQRAEVGDATFWHLHPNHARSTVVGFNEADLVMHAITVSAPFDIATDDELERFRNSTLSVRAHGEKRMDRRIYVPGLYQATGKAFTYGIEDSDERQQMLNLATQPHLSGALIERLVVLGDEDAETLLEWRQTERRRKLYEQQKVLSGLRSRRLPGELT